MEIKAKKSLGQNFLKSERDLNEIVGAGNLKPADLVLEIGPGQGALTKKILETEAKIIAIEKDSELIDFLKNKFEEEIKNNKLEIINGDALDFDPEKTFSNKKYKLIANIPYYITGAIIEKFLSLKNQPTEMVLLVQKEVADRIVAKDKKESILSISVKAYAKPKYIKTVKAGSFVPAPKIDSAIISFQNISKNFFQKNNTSEENFFTVLKAGFAHKRKVLISNLKEKFGNKDNKNLAEIFSKNKIDPKIRAEKLTLDDWANLTRNLTII